LYLPELFPGITRNFIGESMSYLKLFSILLITAGISGCTSGKGRTATMPAAITETKPAVFTADPAQIAYQPKSGGVWYPRMLVLSSGEWVCGFDTNEDGGNGVIKVIISSDEGKIWGAPVFVAGHADASYANAQLAERQDGQLWLAYRVVEEADGICRTSLRVSSSDDRGQTWQELPNGEIARQTSSAYRGVWEPHMGYMGDTFVCMYADDSEAVVEHSQQQTLFMKTWTDAGWSDDPIIVSDGRESNGRDGMPVWSRMQDGRYIVVFETSDEAAQYPFVIKYKISPDGFNWNVPRHSLPPPTRRGKQRSAPYIITLSDGRVMVSFQTDEDKTRFGVAVSENKVMLGDPMAETWDGLSSGVPTSDLTNSIWNSLLPLPDGSFVIASSSSNPDDIARIVLRRGCWE
jgi:hypothetical protein